MPTFSFISKSGGNDDLVLPFPLYLPVVVTHLRKKITRTKRVRIVAGNLATVCGKECVCTQMTRLHVQLKKLSRLLPALFTRTVLHS